VNADLIGWASSIVLLATVVGQVRKQWRARSSEGVSRWLFVGQTAASAGFTVYSALVKNWVFTVTNALLLISALVGCALTLHFRAGPSRARASPSNARDQDAKVETI
jgi:MtN3 and saliva related transmembrane protein